MKHSHIEHKTLVIPPDEQSDLIEEAMKNAQHVTEFAIDEHWKAFLSQIRDKVGVENITLEEPYLKFEIVKSTLKYLKKLDGIEQHFTIIPQVDKSEFVMNLNAAGNRHVMSVKQNMDERRQQEFGIQKYIWRTAMDDRVRPSHAANEGKVFAWKDGDGPGDEENCRCSAEPFPEYTGDDDPPIEPVYPLETLLTIYVGLTNPIVKQIGKELLDWLADDKPTATEPPKPAPKPENTQTAEKIANGHAYDKHVEKKGEFPDIKTREDLKKHIEDVINNPNKTKGLDKGRTGYWDKETGSVVIQDPKSPDGGTIFRPSDSENYFDNILK